MAEIHSVTIIISGLVLNWYDFILLPSRTTSKMPAPAFIAPIY
ncbi:hypothetical protein FDUTEX481_08387 [Tolypothrix sp. PCC 7601]|nr:hypothetical protein FDUTEX481_08387 [Tolypothrix sp. PCC 7601]